MVSLGKVILDDKAIQKRMAERVGLCKQLIAICSHLNSLLHLLNNVSYEGLRDAHLVHYYENRHFENIPYSRVSTPSYPHVCMCTDCHTEGGSLLNYFIMHENCYYDKKKKHWLKWDKLQINKKYLDRQLGNNNQIKKKKFCWLFLFFSF